MSDDVTAQPWWPHLRPHEQAEYREATEAAADARTSLTRQVSELAGVKRGLMERARRRMERAKEKAK